MTRLPEREGLYQQLADDAARIIHSTVAGVVVGVERIPIGVMTHKFAVHLANDLSYVVRFYPPSRSFVVDYEPDVLQRCTRAGIPVPEVVVDSRKGPLATLAYMAYRMVAGTNLADRMELLDAKCRKSVAQRLVECTTQMRKIVFHGYGDLCDGVHADRPTWKSFIQSAYHEGLDAIQGARLLDDDAIAKLIEIGRDLDNFARNDEAQLIWGDVRPQNILVDDQDCFVCLLDFEGVLVGDPLVTLGFGYAALGAHPFFADCVENWPDAINWRQLYFYSVLRLLRIAKYARTPLPTGPSRAALTQILPGFASALNAL